MKSKKEMNNKSKQANKLPYKEKAEEINSKNNPMKNLIQDNIENNTNEIFDEDLNSCIFEQLLSAVDDYNNPDQNNIDLDLEDPLGRKDNYKDEDTNSNIENFYSEIQHNDQEFDYFKEKENEKTQKNKPSKSEFKNAKNQYKRHSSIYNEEKVENTGDFGGERKQINNKKNENNNNTEGKVQKQKHLDRKAMSQFKPKEAKITQYLHNKVLKGNYAKIVSCHNKCRVLQQMLVLTQPSIIEEIFLELKPSLHELLVDIYSNYFCQKLYSMLQLRSTESKYNESSSEGKYSACKEEYLKIVFNNFEYIACNSVGTFPLQKIIEDMTTLTEFELLGDFLVKYLIGKRLWNVCIDKYGVHVIEKILIKFKDDDFPGLKHIHSTVAKNLIAFSESQETLCLVKKMVLFRYKKGGENNLHNENYSENFVCENTVREYKEYFPNFKDKLESKLFQILNTQYGTYVLHTILDDWTNYEQINTMKIVLENCVEISKHPYGSNVIERCLEKGAGRYFLNNFYSIILKSENFRKLEELVFNYFGSFVIRKLIKLMTFKKRSFVMNEVEKIIEKVGKENKIYIRWRDFLDEAQFFDDPLEPSKIPPQYNKLLNIQKDKLNSKKEKEIDAEKRNNVSSKNKPKKDSHKEDNQEYFLKDQENYWGKQSGWDDIEFEGTKETKKYFATEKYNNYKNNNYAKSNNKANFGKNNLVKNEVIRKQIDSIKLSDCNSNIYNNQGIGFIKETPENIYKKIDNKNKSNAKQIKNKDNQLSIYSNDFQPINNTYENKKTKEQKNEKLSSYNSTTNNDDFKKENIKDLIYNNNNHHHPTTTKNNKNIKISSDVVKVSTSSDKNDSLKFNKNEIITNTRSNEDENDKEHFCNKCKNELNIENTCCQNSISNKQLIQNNINNSSFNNNMWNNNPSNFLMGNFNPINNIGGIGYPGYHQNFQVHPNTFYPNTNLNNINPPLAYYPNFYGYNVNPMNYNPMGNFQNFNNQIPKMNINNLNASSPNQIYSNQPFNNNFNNNAKENNITTKQQSNNKNKDDKKNLVISSTISTTPGNPNIYYGNSSINNNVFKNSIINDNSTNCKNTCNSNNNSDNLTTFKTNNDQQSSQKYNSNLNTKYSSSNYANGREKIQFSLQNNYSNIIGISKANNINPDVPGITTNYSNEIAQNNGLNNNKFIKEASKNKIKTFQGDLVEKPHLKANLDGFDDQVISNHSNGLILQTISFNMPNQIQNELSDDNNSLIQLLSSPAKVKESISINKDSNKVDSKELKEPKPKQQEKSIAIQNDPSKCGEYSSLNSKLETEIKEDTIEDGLFSKQFLIKKKTSSKFMKFINEKKQKKEENALGEKKNDISNEKSLGSDPSTTSKIHTSGTINNKESEVSVSNLHFSSKNNYKQEISAVETLDNTANNKGNFNLPIRQLPFIIKTNDHESERCFEKEIKINKKILNTSGEENNYNSNNKSKDYDNNFFNTGNLSTGGSSLMKSFQQNLNNGIWRNETLPNFYVASKQEIRNLNFRSNFHTNNLNIKSNKWLSSPNLYTSKLFFANDNETLKYFTHRKISSVSCFAKFKNGIFTDSSTNHKQIFSNAFERKDFQHENCQNTIKLKAYSKHSHTGNLPNLNKLLSLNNTKIGSKFQQTVSSTLDNNNFLIFDSTAKKVITNTGNLIDTNLKKFKLVKQVCIDENNEDRKMAELKKEGEYKRYNEEKSEFVVNKINPTNNSINILDINSQLMNNKLVLKK